MSNERLYFFLDPIAVRKDWRDWTNYRMVIPSLNNNSLSGKPLKRTYVDRTWVPWMLKLSDLICAFAQSSIPAPDGTMPPLVDPGFGTQWLKHKREMFTEEEWKALVAYYKAWGVSFKGEEYEGKTKLLSHQSFSTLPQWRMRLSEIMEYMSALGMISNYERYCAALEE
jgi:hypothetical protein